MYDFEPDDHFAEDLLPFRWAWLGALAISLVLWALVIWAVVAFVHS